MTAPTPATEVLDQLDELRAKATPGPWEQDGPEGLFASNDSGELLFDYRDVVLVEDHPEGVAQCAADAALIVAAVNRLPQLTAALRAVLALADEGDRMHRTVRTERIRAAVVAALEVS